MTAFDRIPVIDIAPLSGADAAAKARVAADLAEAASRVGFLYITGHGIAPELIEGLEAAAGDFFALPMAVKQKYHIGLSTCHRGYVPTGEEGFYESMPDVVDLKEAFDTALDLPADDPDYRAGNRMLGPNVWPSELPEFRRQVTDYYRAAIGLGRTLFRGFALALGLEEDHFAPYLTKPTSQLRLIHYPPSHLAQTRSDWGIGPHTDFECFTLLHSTQPGLQVQNSAQNWIHASPIPGAFVVNIGDMLEAWSNGRFVATGHRVIKTPRERFSFPLFNALDYPTRVEPMPAFCSPDNPPRYPAIIAGEHLEAQTIRAFRYLRTLLDEGKISLPASAVGRGTFGHDSLEGAAP
ncbi:MAG TPA: 2-oxoglutarate and iron-dependent oxygenase domain-containing protein [Aliidongia sp.]|nr:2-oxoglutarate and iron-dependent oxygenase domain-containing protein [Aliidongia sp.]